MPVLEWIGKNKIISHHNDVPFHVLNKKYSFGSENSKNIIIHSDNLYALKSLLPKYEGLVDCIYIDPPYNTGNEKWVYNDNVNDPRISKWLGQVVGAEGEDLSRHDKWLCMMYPRLKLLQKLLSPKGVIFISIDDNELKNLICICEEIFGPQNFVANITWQRTYSPRNDSKGISNEAEHIVVFSKNPNWMPKKLPRTEKMDKVYKNPDNDISPWRNSDAFAPSAATHQGMVYAIQHPITGELIYPYDGACWPLEQSKMLLEMENWAEYELIDINDSERRAKVCGVPVEDIRKGVKAIMLSEPLESSRAKGLAIIKRGKWPKFFFTKNGYGGIARKTYLDAAKGKVVTNLWPYEEVGHTDEAKKEIATILGDKKLFDTPKPTRLIKRILQIATDKNSIILDSFAGSGTTGQAVLELNNEDGGKRKFIMVEMMDYADNVTAERIKRVVAGYGKGKNEKKPIDGDFSFYELGEPIFDENMNLNSNLDEETIKQFVYYTETHKDLEKTKDNNYLGESDSTAYYMFYKRNEPTCLNFKSLKEITKKADAYVIYADSCTLSQDYMTKNHIIFKKIPRDVQKL